MFAFFSSLAGAFFGFLLKYLIKRGAITFGVIGGVVTVTGLLFIALASAVSSISVVVPDSVRQGLDMVLPSNFLPCISAIFGLKTVIWFWRWKVHFLEMYAGNS